MQYSINLMLLLLVGLSHSACLQQNGESEPQLISPEDSDFAGFNELGVGYDLRERTVSGNQVFNQDSLNLDPSDEDIRRCGFMGSSEDARSEFGFDVGFGIDVRDQFNLDFRFGRNRTSTESTFTGYYGCVNYREVAVVSLDNSASTAQDLRTRNERNEFSDAQFFYDRYGTHYIDRITFGATYNVILRFTTTNQTLLDEWEFSLGFNATITEAIQISGDFQVVNGETFSRTDTRIDLEESARGFLLQESILAEGSGFMDILNNPDAISQRIQANTARFDETGSNLRNMEGTLFGRNLDVKTVASAINGANLIPVSFNLGEFDVIQELSINQLRGEQCQNLETNLNQARNARADLRSMLAELQIDEEDVLDSFGIDAASEQGRAYNRALQIVTTDIRRILSSMNDYFTSTPGYIADNDIGFHSCGYLNGRVELRSRFERLHEESSSTGIEVFEGLSECTFSGIVVDNGMRSLFPLFQQSGCPSDGSGGFSDVDKFFDLLDAQRAANEELVVIGGTVQLTGRGDNDFVQGLRFDENRNAVGLGFIRGPIRDEIVSVDNVCEVIRVNDFVQTALGTAQVHDFSCVGIPSCLLNNRVDTREIRRQLANGRIEVELLSNKEFHFFSGDEISRTSPPPSVLITFKPVIILERLCTVNDKCGDGEGTCYRDAECETNMCHPGTFKHPDYIYPDANEFLSFCVTFERKIARNRNACSPSALCNDGEGSCNSNADCQGTLQCQHAGLNSAYDLRVNQVPSSQKICVRPTNPFDPANCQCCGRGRNSPQCDFTLQEGDGHCQNDNHCAGDLSCIPGTCGLFRSFPNERNEFSSEDSCCVDVSGFQENSDVEGMDLLERVISGSHTGCPGECIRRSECVYWVLNSENDGCYLFRESQNVRVVQRNNRRGFPKVKYGETPLGCPKGMVPTKGGHVNVNLYGGRLQCVKKPADKLCGQGMKFTQRALQGNFDTFSVERDISVCRSMCRGCGAFRYNTDTSECSIFHGLDFILSDEHPSRPDEIVCIYDEEQAGERRVATNICLNPRSGRTTFPISTSGKILSATLVQRNGKIECLERRVLECPTHNTGNQGVFGTPDYCDCCLHGSSCNRCPRGFFHSGIRTACSGRGEFRCHAEGESHFTHSASFACDPSERAQVVLEGGSRNIRFDPVQTQSNSHLLTSVSGEPVEINSIMSIRYLEPSDPKFVFAEGEVCFDIYMIIDDSQITESDGDEPMCYCDTPGAGTNSFNSLSCTNNEQHHCPSGQECFAPAGVPISQRDSACRAPLVAREEIQYHSTECGINDLSRHPVVCDDGYALQSWEMVSCNEGQAVNLIEDERRCVGHVWTDVFGTSAEDCAERLRNTNECRDQSVFQWAQRSDGRCGCFTNTVRNCRYENGRTEEEPVDVYEKFGFKVNYECVRINSKAKESRTSECQKPIGRPFLTTISNTGNESNLGLCEGECDNDGDCAPGLRCFQRNGYAPVPGCSGTGVEDFDYCYDPTTADARNVVEENPAGVGGWGGSCTCPDGSVYHVGDNNDHCGSLACTGGVGGRCNQFEGVWSHRKVTCAPAAPAERAPAFECGENQVLQEFRVDTNSCEGGDVRYNYVCSSIEVSNNLGGVVTYPVAHHFEQNIGFVRCGSGDLLRGWSGTRNIVNAQCLQRGEGYEPVGNHQVACGWQESVNGQGSTVGGNSINCGRICDSRSDCASFTVCGDTCFFTSTDFSRSKVCNQEFCTSYNQANFRLPE